MTSLVYNFDFGSACAGLDAAVTDAYTDEAIEDSPVTLDSSGAAQVTLVQGNYNALVASADRDDAGDIVINGVLDIPASIEAAALLPEAPA